MGLEDKYCLEKRILTRWTNWYWITVLRRQVQKDFHELKAKLGYIA